MLSLWMFGSRLEQDWGRQRFLEFYFFSVIGGGLCTVAISYAHVLGMDPRIPTVGASGGIFGLLVAFGILYAKMRVYIYGIFPIEARWLAIIWIALAVYAALASTGNVNEIAHLGGALFSYIYLKALPRRGLQFATSEGYYGIRNKYQRWKRRRMAKKFEVFMKQHDRKQYFDEYGNFRPPTEEERRRDEEKGKGSGWVN
jgi:membrane associated rhomboid family serine protease